MRFRLLVIAIVAASGPVIAAEPESTVRKDLYGDPLPRGAIARTGTLRFRHGDIVSGVTFTPDGEIVVTTSNGALSFWESQSGRLLRRTDVSAGLLTYLPDGESLATLTDSDGDLYFWDFANSPPPAVEAPPTAGVLIGGDEIAGPGGDDHESFSCFALSGNGKILAGATAGNTDRERLIQIWRPDAGKKLKDLVVLAQLERNQGNIQWIGLSNDGSRLVSLSRESGPRRDPNMVKHVLTVWNVVTAKELRSFDVPPVLQQGSNSSATISRDGRFVALGTEQGTIHLLDVTDGKKRRRLNGHKRAVSCVAFSPDGNRLVSGGWDDTARVWEVATGKQLTQFAGHRSWVECVTFSSDGRTIASGGQDYLVRLWDASTGKDFHAFNAHDFWVMAMDLSADGKTLVTAGWDGTIRMWDATTGRQLLRIQAQQDRVVALALSTDGKLLATAGVSIAEAQRRITKRTILLWDMKTGNQIRQFGDDHQPVGFNSLAFSPHGRLLLSAGEKDKTIHVWDVATGNELRQFEHHAEGLNEITCIALSSDGKVMATAGSKNGFGNGEIYLWNFETGKQLHSGLRHKGNVTFLAFSPDGKAFASAGHSTASNVKRNGKSLASPDFRDSLQIWDVATGKRLRQFPGEPDSSGSQLRHVNSVVFSDDGRFLISGEKNGSIVIYDVASGDVRKKLAGHRGSVRAIDISKSGKLASLSLDLTVLVWDLNKVLD